VGAASVEADLVYSKTSPSTLSCFAGDSVSNILGELDVASAARGPPQRPSSLLCGGRRQRRARNHARRYSFRMDLKATEVAIIGGGQAGLALSYRLTEIGRPHVISSNAGSSRAGGPSAGTRFG
jgi:hypothetical protein